MQKNSPSFLCAKMGSGYKLKKLINSKFLLNNNLNIKDNDNKRLR